MTQQAPPQSTVMNASSNHYSSDILPTSPPLSFYLSSESSKMTLWMGDLDSWMDEQYLQQLWSTKGENVLIKLIRDKKTGNSLGYAFIGFTSSIAAQRALATVHGTKMPNSLRPFRLNWASGGGILDKKEDRAPEYSLFVGDLSSDVDETYLLAMFRQRYASCHSAKVMTDPVSGLSRGYGFVRFHDQFEQQDALIEMNGVYCGHRPIRISLATPKGGGPLNTAPLSSSSSSSSSNNIQYHQQPNLNQNQQNQHHARYYQLALQAPALVQQPTDPSNTTVFVGGLSAPLNEEELRQYFIPFGEVTYVKIPPGKGCGFVQYVSRQSAELAIERMNGFQIGQSRIRLSWGRSQNDKGDTSGPQQPSTPFHLPTPSPSLLLLKQQQQQQQYQLQMQQSLMDHSPYITSRGYPTSNHLQYNPSPSDTPNLPPFLRKTSHPINNDHDPNAMISPVSSISGKTNAYSTMNNNHSMALTTSPTLQSFSSSSSSGRFSLLFPHQEDNHPQKPIVPHHDQDLYYPPSSSNHPNISASPSSSSSLHQQPFAPEWTSTLTSVSTSTAPTHSEHPPPVTDHDSNQVHYWRRLGGIYA